MKKHFYSHIIEVDSIDVALNDLDLEVHEKDELVVMAESSIHHVVIDTLLSEMSEEDKRTFLAHLTSDKHDELWEHINKKIDKAETKIKKAVDDLIKELHEDIKEAKEKKD